MTDGMIQKEFNEFRSHYLGIPITHERLCYLERRIIEKIKQNWREINKTHAMCSCDADIEIFEMLLGDNQK